MILIAIEWTYILVILVLDKDILDPFFQIGQVRDDLIHIVIGQYFIAVGLVEITARVIIPIGQELKEIGHLNSESR